MKEKIRKKTIFVFSLEKFLRLFKIEEVSSMKMKIPDIVVSSISLATSKIKLQKKNYYLFILS